MTVVLERGAADERAAGSEGERAGADGQPGPGVVGRIGRAVAGRPWLPGAVLVLAGGATRLGDREIWVDEAFSLAATHDLPTTLSRTSGTMGLYYALLTPWAAVSEAAPWVRSLSLLLMAAAVGVLATVVARWHGTTAGVVAGLLAGGAYLPARLAVEARSYALVALLVAVSWAALDRVVADGARGRWWRVYVVCVLLLPLAHGLAALQVIAQVAAVLVARPDRRTWLRHTVAAAVSGGVVLVLLVAGIEGVGDWLDPLSPATASAFLCEVVHPVRAIAVLLVALAAWGAVAARRDHLGATPADRFRRVALLLWGPGAVALVLALSAVRPSHLGRYSVSAALGLAGLAAVGLVRLPRVRRSTRLAAVGVVVVLVVLGQAAIDVARPQPWTDTAALVAAEAADGDLLAFTDPEVRLPFEVAWVARGATPEVVLAEPGTALGTLDRYPRIPTAAETAAALPAGARLWLVDQDLPHATNRRSDPLDDPAFAARVRVVDTWSIAPSIQVRLLVVRP
jgi:hypothetical protein